MAYGFIVIMGGFAVQTSDNKRYRLNQAQFQHLYEAGRIELPSVDSKDIADKNKADWMIKSVACVQVTWLCVQVISRLVLRLPVTNLELFTLAMAFCALGISLAWWHKPHDVGTPFIIHCDYDLETLSSHLPLEVTSDGYFALGERVSLDDSLPIEARSWWQLYLSCTAMCAVFGGCHLLGWNSGFVSQVEMWLWRSSAVICATFPLMLIGFIWFDHDSTNLVGLAVMAVYVIARCVILVEVFVSLRSVSEGVYVTVPWERFFPHL